MRDWGDGRLIFCSERGEELKKLVVRMLKNYTITATDQFLLEGSLYLFFIHSRRRYGPLSGPGARSGQHVYQKGAGVYPG